MDYNHNRGNGGDWDWQGEDYCRKKDNDASECFWNEVALNEEDMSYMLDETTTPVKACAELAYHVNHSENRKESEELRECSSQLKRRRMLQFDTNSPLCDEVISTAFLQSNETEESLDEILPQASDWVPGFPDVSAPGYEVLDQSSEEWFADCFNEAEMEFSSNNMNFPGAPDIQIDISEFCNRSLGNEVNVVPKRVSRSSPNVIFKGKKSFIQTPTKLAASVIYPFDFIKPCEFQGDVTLKDINQKILTPPPSKLKQKEEDTTVYPTSAFSGKPVIGTTKIRTEGGKGSITIMRTKG